MSNDFTEKTARGHSLANQNAKEWNDRFQAEREEIKAAKLRHPSTYERES